MNIKPFTDQELSVLVEEYITQQHSEFPIKDLYSYIVYWAMEEHRIVGDKLQEEDKIKIGHILERITRDGRIVTVSENTKMLLKQ